jgi:RNA polymerase sigma-70 factor (ECF subfamily)
MASGAERGRPGDEVLVALHEQHYDRVVRYIAARTADRDLAEDLASDVFLRAVESFPSYRDRGLPIEAWLFRIARNIVIDHYRRSAKRRTIPIDETFDVAGTSDIAGEVEQRMAMELVNQMMTKLNPDQREVISLRFMGGLSSAEAGAVLSRTLGATRELQRTALKALRSFMGKEGDGE